MIKLGYGMDVFTVTQRVLFLILWLYLIVGVVTEAEPSHDDHKDVANHLEDIVDNFSKLLGSSAVKDKLAELTKSSGSERQQVIILKKSDIADNFPEKELHNTTSIVRKIGDVTVVVNTTIDSTKDGDGLVITFESEVKPPSNAKVCKTDADCSEHHFCHREIFLGFDLSYCMGCSKNGGRCHADSNCCEKSICRWGRCRDGATSGQIGTICGKDADCGDNECCALVEGINEPICRPLANEGQHCCSEDDVPATERKNHPKSSSLSIFDKLLQHRSASHQSFAYECPCIQGLKCVNYGQTFDNIFDLPDPQIDGVCVPDWAKPDRPVAPALDQITKLQAKQISDVIGDVNKGD